MIVKGINDIALIAPVAGGLAIYPDIEVDFGSANPMCERNGKDQTYKTPTPVIIILNLKKLSIFINKQKN